MGFEITTETATVYKLRFRKNEGEQERFGWADAAVRSWKGGGSISIQSDYGNYAYTWTAIGSASFLSFLIGLNFDYFMGKACPGYRQFAHEKTVDAIKRMIVERRREAPDHFTIVRQEPSPQSMDFWKELWPHFKEAWRAELTRAAT